jgi:hypothetical protein
MKMLLEFIPWFWDTYLGDDGQGPFIAWTCLIIAIFLGIAGYFFGWIVIAYFFGGVIAIVAVAAIVGYILLIRDAWITFQARLFDKLRGGPARKV